MISYVTPSRGFACTAGAVVLLTACGATGGSNSTASQSPSGLASAARTTSPTAASQDIPDATRFTASNCTGPAPTTAARQLGRYFTIRAAEHWTESPPPQQTETLLLELQAPSVYGFRPVLIQFHSLIGPVHTVYGPQATAHSIAQQHASAVAQEWSPDAVAGPVSDCRIGGEPAAVFGVSGDLVSSSGTTTGKFIWIYMVHKDLLFKVILVGAGGMSDQAIQDSLGMIGSLTWRF